MSSLKVSGKKAHKHTHNHTQSNQWIWNCACWRWAASTRIGLIGQVKSGSNRMSNNGKTVCVNECDRVFFPLSNSFSRCVCMCVFVYLLYDIPNTMHSSHWFMQTLFSKKETSWKWALWIVTGIFLCVFFLHFVILITPTEWKRLCGNFRERKDFLKHLVPLCLRINPNGTFNAMYATNWKLYVRSSA